MSISKIITIKIFIFWQKLCFLSNQKFLGLPPRTPKRKKLTSEKDKQHKIYSYLLDKYWSNLGTSKTVGVPNANEVWSGDISVPCQAAWEMKVGPSQSIYRNRLQTTVCGNCLRALSWAMQKRHPWGVRYRLKKTNNSEPPFKCRKRFRWCQNQGGDVALG